MSFRIRVLILVLLVAVTATGATAWLTQRIVSGQFTEEVTESERAREVITGKLTSYGRQHGTWEGVAGLVEALGGETGERIKLVTEFDVVLVDTDTLAGRTARPVRSRPSLVNPRPTLQLGPKVFTKPTGDLNPEDVYQRTANAIDVYRAEVLLGACLTRKGILTKVYGELDGVPLIYADPLFAEAEEAERICRTNNERTEADRPEDIVAARSCATQPAADQMTCLQEVFAQRTFDVAPLSLNVYIGAVGEMNPVALWPVLTGAVVVALLTALAVVLLSRRVLRPVVSLIAASREFGSGQLHRRVPVQGNDELAALARSFNKMADSLQRAEDQQRRLVADVAHELRTPLANLRGYLEALKDGVIPPESALFASLHDEALLQQRIVDDLQDLALAESGALTYHLVPTDLGELLETCRISHLAVADAAGIQLICDVETPIEVKADPDRLRQVIGNLLSNALRHTSRGGKITIRATASETTAVITVADTGSGIKSADIPHIFDRFWRADPARGRATGGNGLGLAIARQIVVGHHGDISVTSTLGQGTAFTITLPG